MKSITPVISIILLVMLTIVASGAAYFFITSSTTDLQSQGNVDTYPGNDNSRLNIVSITGNKFIVRNDGTSSVIELVVFINDELFNYTLEIPIQPGEYKEVSFENSQIANEDLEIKIIYNAGKTAQLISPARLNTVSAGFNDSAVSGESESSESGNDFEYIDFLCLYDAVNFDNTTKFHLHNNDIVNPGFENNLISSWELKSNNSAYNRFVEISSNSNNGNYSINITNLNTSEIEIIGVYQENVSNTDYFSFWINSSVNELINNSFVLVNVNFYPYDDAHSIYYALFENFDNINLNCSQIMEDGIIYCLNDTNGYDLVDNEWNYIQVNPVTDYLAINGTDFSSTEFIKLSFVVGPGTSAFFDDIFVNGTMNDITCGCNSTSAFSVNNLTNGGFESGEEGWYLKNSEISSDYSSEGVNSTHLFNSSSSTASDPETVELLDDLDYLMDNFKLDINTTSNSNGNYLILGVVSFRNDTSDGVGIAYILNSAENDTILDMCDDYVELQPSIFINCSYRNTTFDEFITYNITGIQEHIIDKFPSYDMSWFNESKLNIIAQVLDEPSTVEAYVDNIFIGEQAQNYLCDSNNDFIADGICASNVCETI
jgi:flagellin-like protein